MYVDVGSEASQGSLPNALRIECDRSKLEYQLEDTDLPIFHPIQVTCKADLVLKVTKDGEDQCLIPLHSEFIGENIQYFKDKMRTMMDCHLPPKNKMDFAEQKTLDGDLIKRLDFEFPYAPSILCGYFRGLYKGHVELTTETALGYRWIGAFFKDNHLLEATNGFLKDNLDNDIILNVWAESDDLHPACVNHIQTYGISFREKDKPLVQSWDMATLSELVSAIGWGASSKQVIQVLMIWLEAHNTNSDVESLFISTNFTRIPMSFKFDFYQEVIHNLVPDLNADLIKLINKELFKSTNAADLQGGSQKDMLQLLDYLELEPSALMEVRSKVRPTAQDINLRAALETYAEVNIQHVNGSGIPPNVKIPKKLIGKRFTIRRLLDNCVLTVEGAQFTHHRRLVWTPIKKSCRAVTKHQQFTLKRWGLGVYAIHCAYNEDYLLYIANTSGRDQLCLWKDDLGIPHEPWISIVGPVGRANLVTSASRYGDLRIMFVGKEAKEKVITWRPSCRKPSYAFADPLDIKNMNQLLAFDECTDDVTCHK